MAKKKTSKNKKQKKIAKNIPEKSEQLTPKELKRKKINKYTFYGSWIVWFLIMLPMYLPNKCAAFFEPVFHASFECPPISLAISLILGSLFMAFLTWIICVVTTWVYFYHKNFSWKNFKKWLNE